jgi:type IV fimbrial biogenesis protein FimT
MNQRGISLTELLAVLAVIGILLGMAVPGYGYLVNNMRLSGVTNDLVSSLNLARSEAIKRGLRVTVCKSSNTMEANPACNSAGGWQQGWIVFVDRGVVGSIDGEDQTLEVQEGKPKVSISSGVNFGKYVSYMPSGVSRGQSNLPNGTINICLNGSLRKVILNSTGRIKLKSESC